MAIPHAVSKLTIAAETVHVSHVLSAGAASRPRPDEHRLETSSVLAITAAQETTAIAERAAPLRVVVPRGDKRLRVQVSNTGARSWPLPSAPRGRNDGEPADREVAEHLFTCVWPGAARRPSAPSAWEMWERS